MDPQNPTHATPIQTQTNNLSNPSMPDNPIPTKGNSKLVIILIVVVAVVIAVSSSIPFILIQVGLFKARVQLGPNGSVNTTGNTITVKNKDTSMTAGQEVNLPENFPSDVPLYPNSKVIQVITSETSGGAAVNFSVQNSDISTVINFYKTKMAENGWTGKDVIIQQTGSMINFEKGSDVMQLVAGTNSAGTFFSISYKN